MNLAGEEISVTLHIAAARDEPHGFTMASHIRYVGFSSASVRDAVLAAYQEHNPGHCGAFVNQVDEVMKRLPAGGWTVGYCCAQDPTKKGNQIGLRYISSGPDERIRLEEVLIVFRKNGHPIFFPVARNAEGKFQRLPGGPRRVKVLAPDLFDPSAPA